ncbi:MAG TPA: response regulator, partial [Longimicrobiales bacterium]
RLTREGKIRNMARILVVDDDPDVVGVIRKELVACGHDVVTAADGETALEWADARALDLVVADLVLPGMDGIELMLALRRRWPELPLLAISGGGLVSKDILLGMAEQLGAHGILQKPFASSELRKAVDALLET